MILSRPARGLFVFAIALLAFSLLSVSVRAQSAGSIAGLVTDAQGGAIVGAKVTAHNNATGIERSTVTESTGQFLLAAMPIGNYRVTAQAQGFQTKVADNVIVQVAVTTDLDVTLAVGQVSQTVNVEASAPVIESTTMEVGQTITQRTVQEIPLNGRHFVDLGLLLPGSVVQPQSGFLTAPLRGQGAFAFDTAGNREDTVNFLINGVNLNDMVQNQITFQPSINTVAEFSATNSTFSAEYGRNSGAIVNIGTRSGTNHYHGEGFDFLRNDYLDARNFFDKTIPPFKRNNFGFNIGGPIWLGPSHPGKDRSFFFFSYEGLRQRQGLTINTPVLTSAQRASVTNPVIQQLLQFIPPPNVGTNFVGAATAPVNIDQWTVDISHRISDKDSLHGYYAFQRDLRQEPTLQGNNLPGFGDTRQSHRQVFTFNETHIFSDRAVNEFRMGYNRIHILFSPNAQLNPANFGISDGVSSNLGLPQIGVSGAFNFGGPAGFPQGRTDTGFLWGDTFNYLIGKHSLKLGTELRIFHNNNLNNDTGQVIFSSIPNFLNGVANQFNITLGAVQSQIRTKSFGLFVQDNYKFSSNLTFELGLRWDMNTTPTEANGRFSNFVPSSGTLVTVGQGLGQIYASNNMNFGPRVGFAWDPFGSGKTSVRGGYGLYYDQPVTNSVIGLTTNPPFANPLSAAGSLSLSSLLTGSGAPAVSPNAINSNFRNAYVQSWNLNVQRELLKSFSMQVGYFGSKGTHLRMFHNINQPVVPGNNATRPFAGFSNIVQVDSPSNSTYNALWVSATKRVSSGLQFSASYSWSHSIDWISLSSPSATTMMAQDSYNLRNERGSSDFDARHHFNISYIYDFPFKANRLVEGWELAGITTFQSGNPVDIIVTNAALTGFATRRANVVGDPALAAGPTREAWFNTAAFCAPGAAGCVGPTVFGNAGRNFVTGPGFANFDWSLIKTTTVKENFKVQLRAEFFDIFNHANFGQPGRVVGTSTFGQIINTRFGTGDSGSSRQIQLAIKLMF
ncbi:MAG: TonB-dependent receptor [Acidobacteriia bacterium]|nr:TonB-dependent receptor [Terriglobia bacterium]